MRYYTGLDLHKRYSEITVIDEYGNLIKQAKLPNIAKDIKYF